MTSSLWADLEGTEEICPSGGSNSPAVRAGNLTQFGEKRLKPDSIQRERERIAERFYPPVRRAIPRCSTVAHV